MAIRSVFHHRLAPVSVVLLLDSEPPSRLCLYSISSNQPTAGRVHLFCVFVYAGPTTQADTLAQVAPLVRNELGAHQGARQTGRRQRSSSSSTKTKKKKPTKKQQKQEELQIRPQQCMNQLIQMVRYVNRRASEVLVGARRPPQEHHCTKCMAVGHNRRSCTAEPIPATAHPPSKMPHPTSKSDRVPPVLPPSRWLPKQSLNCLIFGAWKSRSPETSSMGSSRADAKVRLCRRIYDTMLKWVAEADTAEASLLVASPLSSALRPPPARVLLMGDFNETITGVDRQPGSRTARPNRFISKLSSAGFVDTYRSVYPMSMDGWTCATTAQHHHLIRSRLDYIWSKGFSPAHVLKIGVHERPPSVRTSHRILLADILCDVTQGGHLPSARTPLPNLRTATDEAKASMALRFDGWVTAHWDRIQRMSIGSKEDVVELGDALVDTAWRCSSTLPFSGGGATHKPSRPRWAGRGPRGNFNARGPLSCERMALGRKRQALAQLKRQLNLLAASIPNAGVIDHTLPLDTDPTVRSRIRYLLRHCDIDTDAPGFGALNAANIQAWLSGVRASLNAARKQERKMAKVIDGDKLGRTEYSGDKWKINPAMFIHRMMDGDRAPDIRSIIDPATNRLEVEPEQIKRVLRDHYSSVFSNSVRSGAPPAWVNEMNRPKSGVQSSWYDGLMADITDDDLIAAVAEAKLVSAPGADRVSSGIWRVLITESEAARKAVSVLLSACSL